MISVYYLLKKWGRMKPFSQFYIIPSVHINITWRNSAEKADKKAIDREYLDPKMAAMMKVFHKNEQILYRLFLKE